MEFNLGVNCALSIIRECVIQFGLCICYFIWLFNLQLVKFLLPVAFFFFTITWQRYSWRLGLDLDIIFENYLWFFLSCSWFTLWILYMQVVLGTLLASLVPVVGFNAVMTSEHFASFLVSFPLFFGQSKEKWPSFFLG